MASSCSGSASSLSSIVTTAACSPGTRSSVVATGSSPVCARRSSFSALVRCSTVVTLPTLTPAIRTGDSGRMFCAELKTALTS